VDILAERGSQRFGSLFAELNLSADAPSLGLPPARLPGLVRVIQAQT